VLVVVLTVIIAVLVGLHYYLWRRLVRDTTVKHGWPRRIGTVLTVAMPVQLVAIAVLTHDGRLSPLGWGYLWIALMFYLLIALALLEIPRFLLHRRARTLPSAPVTDSPSAAAGPDPGRRLVLARGVAIMAGLTATGVTGYGVTSALGPPRLRRLQIPLATLPRAMDGFRVAVVSDIHLGPLAGRAHTTRIVDMINTLDADLVAIVGDLVDGSVAALGPAAAPLRQLKSRYGTYFVNGNHETFSGVQEWMAELPELGVRVLRNELVRCDGLQIAGVNDPSAAGQGLGPDFTAALTGRDPQRPVVLLAHQPILAPEAARHGVDLQLSGHTHGGQLAPFNLLVALQQPVVSGLGRVDGMPVFVTNGAGFWGPPARVGAPPEIVLIQLRSGR